MLKSDARVHAVVWLAAAQKMLPRAVMDNETAKLHRALAALADHVGRGYASVSEGNHPLTDQPMKDE